jgi:hypothetical protein
MFYFQVNKVGANQKDQIMLAKVGSPGMVKAFEVLEPRKGVLHLDAEGVDPRVGVLLLLGQILSLVGRNHAVLSSISLVAQEKLTRGEGLQKASAEQGEVMDSSWYHLGDPADQAVGKPHSHLPFVTVSFVLSRVVLPLGLGGRPLDLRDGAVDQEVYSLIRLLCSADDQPITEVNLWFNFQRK